MNTGTTNTADAEIMLRQARRIQELAGEIVGLTAGLKALREENNRQDLIIEELRPQLTKASLAPQTDLDTYDAHMSIAEVGVMQDKINTLLEACKAVYNDPYTTCSCSEKLRAAIAKVEGK